MQQWVLPVRADLRQRAGAEVLQEVSQAPVQQLQHHHITPVLPLAFKNEEYLKMPSTQLVPTLSKLQTGRRKSLKHSLNMYRLTTTLVFFFFST